jgi:hypothetical protein
MRRLRPLLLLCCLALRCGSAEVPCAADAVTAEQAEQARPSRRCHAAASLANPVPKR